MKDLEEIKFKMLMVLSGLLSKEVLANCLCYISDKSGISLQDDFFMPSEFSYTQVFVRKSMVLLSEKRFDDWLNLYKNELIGVEQYELINELHL